MTRCVPAEDRIAVIGAGRIGATTAIGLAHIGWRVDAIDRQHDRVTELGSGVLSEPELGIPARQDIPPDPARKPLTQLNALPVDWDKAIAAQQDTLMRFQNEITR
jgi:2-polyprenyl-6-methoxyphenol hydroxylase-like FAD-dependent oxidoreductase